ncbi:MAG: diguanylate cyclase [Burkholderiales bacterium]|nr:MAG: diguanylate cyclase [Burkholderiales bacterium]
MNQPLSEDRARIGAQLVRQSMQSAHYAWVGSAVLAALFSAVHWRETGAAVAFYWFGALAVLLLARALYCRRLLAGETAVQPAATLAYGAFAAAEGLAWAAALVLLRVADPSGFLLQFTLTLGVSIGLLLPFGAVPALWLAALVPLAAAQAFALSKSSLPHLDLVLLVWGAVLALAAFACVRLRGGVRQALQLQIDGEHSAEAQAKALADLKDSRDQLRLGLDAIDAGVADTDVATGDRFFSLRYMELLGYKDRESFIREYRFSDSLHPSDSERVLEARRRHIEEGAPFRQEFRVRTAGGEYIWVQARGESIRDDRGRATRFVMSIVDITKRREAEEKLVASERRYRALFEATPSLIWTCNRDGMITLVSGRACQMIYGEKPKHVLGRHVTAFNAPEFTLRMFMRLFRPVLQGEAVFDVEAVHRTRNGKTLHVMVSAIPTMGADGKLESVLGVCTDITAQKRRERELAVALRNQQVIFDAAGEGIAFVQSERIERANGALAQLLGVQPAWLGGRPAADILADAADWQRILEMARAAAQRGESANHEVMLRAPEGGAGGRGVWSQLTARLVGADGEAEAMILVLTDITPLKQREEMAWHQANHDELTSLPNRRLLVENARRLLSVAMRRDRLAALMVLDLDGFKEVNDAFGHAYGDAMLRRVAMRMSMALREYDLIARTGGDEFVILLPEIDDPEGARAAAEKLIAAASEDFETGDRLAHTSASVGIALFPADGQDFDSLLRRADAAMYASKQAGKNRCTFASPLHAEPIIPPAPAGLRPH